MTDRVTTDDICLDCGKPIDATPQPTGLPFLLMKVDRCEACLNLLLFRHRRLCVRPYKVSGWRPKT